MNDGLATVESFPSGEGVGWIVWMNNPTADVKNVTVRATCATMAVGD